MPRLPLLIESDNRCDGEVYREFAAYTDGARQAGIQGKVVLRVVFQANGSIGAVDVVSGLPEGLTEEAVKAARMMVFILPPRCGSRHSVTKLVEYSFTIY